MFDQDPSLKKFVMISAALHVSVGLFLVVGLPVFFSPPDVKQWVPVPVDIVDIGEITNTRVRKEIEQEARKTAPKEKPAPAPKPEEEKPPVKEAVEEAPKPPEELAPPEEESIEKPKKPEKEKPKEKPKPKEDPLASVLKNVAKLQPATEPDPDAQESEKKQEGSTNESASTQTGPALADRLTISQEDALRRQISSCWNMPIGARDAENLIVEVLIEVNEDRTVRKAEVVDQYRFSTDSHFRAAAEAALRALRHPRCTPLELPPDQYEQWKTIRFNFDPRDML